MALIKCPDCGKSVSDVAPSCPNCGRPISGQVTYISKKKGSSIKTGCLAIIIGLMAIGILSALIFGGRTKSPNSSSSSSKDYGTGTAGSISVGEEGRLYSGAELVPVAVSREAFDAWTKARVANDTHGQGALLVAGLILTPQKGTKVLVIDSAFLIRKVRILEGEFEGQAGWVSSDYIRK